MDVLLTPQQLEAISYLATPGWTVKKSAQQVGCDRRTLHRWLNDPLFLHEYHRQVRVVAARRRSELHLAAVEAVHVLREIAAKGQSEANRMRAANYVLQHADEPPGLPDAPAPDVERRPTESLADALAGLDPQGLMLIAQRWTDLLDRPVPQTLLAEWLTAEELIRDSESLDEWEYDFDSLSEELSHYVDLLRAKDDAEAAYIQKYADLAADLRATTQSNDGAYTSPSDNSNQTC